MLVLLGIIKFGIYCVISWNIEVIPVVLNVYESIFNIRYCALESFIFFVPSSHHCRHITSMSLCSAETAAVIDYRFLRIAVKMERTENLFSSFDPMARSARSLSFLYGTLEIRPRLKIWQQQRRVHTKWNVHMMSTRARPSVRAGRTKQCRRKHTPRVPVSIEFPLEIKKPENRLFCS